MTKSETEETYQLFFYETSHDCLEIGIYVSMYTCNIIFHLVKVYACC